MLSRLCVDVECGRISHSGTEWGVRRCFIPKVRVFVSFDFDNDRHLKASFIGGGEVARGNG